jgi:oligoribonuclease NrnB/cAMP/cGMP phosphodiesterase (DHH superfamily)
MKTICIYHANCADGFGSAWVVRKAFMQYWPDEEIEFHPGIYQTPPPDVSHKNVIMVDFSYKRPVVEAMLSVCNNMVIIDHHASAIDDLSNLIHDRLIKIFDNNHSGAMLTWNHFFPGEDAPWMLIHIEDRDLWRFKYSDTRAIQANLFSFPYDFSEWTHIAQILQHSEGRSGFAAEGKAIERKHFKDIYEHIGEATRWIRLGPSRILMPIINCPKMWGSDAAHILAEKQLSVKIAAYYWDGSDSRNFGLRSVGNVDCPEIAKFYGGGGHPNSAGFKVSFEVAKTLELETFPF